MEQSGPNEFSQAMRRSTGSFELVASPLLLALIGLGLDRLFGTTPWLVVIFAVAGFIGATIKLFYGYKLEMQQHESEAPWAAQ